uniref:Lipid-binding serum glycoprotein C-terminal domain-containing protein n=1 Tax=Acrobeloides nanus TaxID=290746 RepID=A0A914C8C1_9BILA
MSQYLRQRVEKFMKFGEISYNLTVPVTPTVSFTLISEKISKFELAPFQSQTKFVEGKEILWTGSQFTATVNSMYKMQGENGEVVGHVPVTFFRMTIEISLATSINGDGHLKSDIQQCLVYVGDMIFDFAANDAEVLRNHLPSIQTSLRDQAGMLLCPTFHAELVPLISNRLMNTPMSAALFDHYFINYGLVGPVVYNSDNMQLNHRGNVFGILRQGGTRLNDFRLPFRSTPFELSSNVTKMVTFQMSNYTLASLLFWMDQYRRFDFEINKQTVNNSNIAGYLRTECGLEDICAGTLFPALSQKFANGDVNIKSRTTTFPKVQLEEGKALIFFDSRIDAFVNQSDRNRRFLTANMHHEVHLTKPTFKDYKFRALLNIDSFKITNVVSLVEGIDETSMEFLISALNELIINDEVSKKLKEGIKLPILLDFEQTSSEIRFEKERIILGADFCFEEGCSKTNVSQSRDMDVNYYDVSETT